MGLFNLFFHSKVLFGDGAEGSGDKIHQPAPGPGGFRQAQPQEHGGGDDVDPAEQRRDLLLGRLEFRRIFPVLFFNVIFVPEHPAGDQDVYSRCDEQKE